MLIEELEIPEEKYFKDTTDDIATIMEKLNLEEETDTEEDEAINSLTAEELDARNIGYRKGLSDILKTKLN